MIRFRNPGTQYSTQIQVMKLLYKELGHQSYFTLDDMAVVIAKANLMTAYGYAGDNAIKLSNTELSHIFMDTQLLIIAFLRIRTLDKLFEATIALVNFRICN